MIKRRILIALGVLLPFVMVLPALAQSSTDYEYVTQIIIENGTGAILANVAVRVPINASNLVDGGFLAADGQDMLVLDSGASENQITAQLDGNGSSWWFPLGSLAIGASETMLLYTGQNTPTADNPQSIFVTNVASAAEDISGAFTPVTTPALATLVLDDFVAIAWPTSASVTVGAAGGLTTRINTSGVFEMLVKRNTGVTLCTLTSALSLNTIYDVTAVYDQTVDPECKLTINGSESTQDVAGGPTITDNTAVKFGGVAGFVARLGGWSYEEADVSPGGPDEQFSYTFEPPHLSETEAGTSGNGFTWLGSIQDQSSGGNDGTYTFVRDTSNITVTVGHVISTDPAVTLLGETDPSVVTGNVTSPITDPFTNPSAVSDFGFPWNLLADSAVAGDVPLQLLALTIVMAGGGFAGFVTYRKSTVPGLAIFAAATIAGMLVYLTPISNGIVLLIAIPSISMVVLIPQPFEARGIRGRA